MVEFIRRAALFLLLLCLGCSAQQGASNDVNRRVERMVRSHFSIPASVDVKVTGRKQSPDFPSYDVVSVTLSRADKSTTHDFLLSKDNKKLLQMNEIVDPMEKIDVSGRPTRGAKNAKVVLVNYDDFECPFCARNHQELMQDILKQYGDRVQIVYKDYPLAEIHPWATRAAVDGNCLAAQNNDAYWDFADSVHATQKDITGSGRTLDQQFAALDKVAADAGQKHSVDAGLLQACIKAQKADAVKASVAEGDSVGVSATPTMFINGVKMDGAVPPDQLRAALDRALRDAGQPVPAASSTPSAPAPAAPTGNR